MKSEDKLPKDLRSVLNKVASLYGQQLPNEESNPIPNVHDLHSLEFVMVAVDNTQQTSPNIDKIIIEASKETVSAIYEHSLFQVDQTIKVPQMYLK